jgi:hypothetical protein
MCAGGKRSLQYQLVLAMLSALSAGLYLADEFFPQQKLVKVRLHLLGANVLPVKLSKCVVVLLF